MSDQQSTTPKPFKEDLTGRTFGKLTVLGFAGRRKFKGGNSVPMWLCQCACGSEAREVQETNLKSGTATACRDCSQRKHGGKGTRLYRIYVGMKDRCYNPRSGNYERWGARGIVVCDRWLGKSGFVNFAADMGEPPTEQHTLGRIDNDGPYCKENCQWETRLEQTRNRSNSVRITHDGLSLSPLEWAERTGLPVKTIWYRLYRGWNPEEILTTPPGRPQGSKE